MLKYFEKVSPTNRHRKVLRGFLGAFEVAAFYEFHLKMPKFDGKI